MAQPSCKPKPLQYLIVLGAIATTCSAEACAQQPTVPRAPRPDWHNQDVSDVFFDDAFRDGLRGQRPLASDPQDGAPGQQEAVRPVTAWSDFISARALEEEIKRGEGELRGLARNAAQLSGPSAIEAALRLRHLAAVLGIIAQYDVDVRWKDAAGNVAAQLTASSRAVAKGDGASLAEASDTLQALTRGSLNSQNRGGIADLSPLVSRSAVMHRLNQAVEKEIGNALRDGGTFRRQAPRLGQEAELIAALTRLLTLNGVEDSMDEDYCQMCEDLLSQARMLREAAESNDLEKAKQQWGVIQNSCAACHEVYRG